jgi:hypothetical protein
MSGNAPGIDAFHQQAQDLQFHRGEAVPQPGIKMQGCGSLRGQNQAATFPDLTYGIEQRESHSLSWSIERPK